MAETTQNILLDRVRNGLPLSIGERFSLALQLSIPCILAQLSFILMQYIDASMVGSLGAQASASVGLVSTSTWLVNDVVAAIISGFSVLVAHRVGAKNNRAARLVLRQAITFCFLLALAFAVVGTICAPFLPSWLGGADEIKHDSTVYFLFFSCTVPIWSFNFLLASMLRSAGNMTVPSLVNVAMCILNVAFNYAFIFIAQLGVLGAALGTTCAVSLSAIYLFYYTRYRSVELRFSDEKGSFRPEKEIVDEAMQIGLPMAIEHFAFCSAHILSTLIVAPLGTVAIAANAFAITIEGLCYMPGFGIGDTATTLVGQSIGANRPRLQRSFGYITLLLGMGAMTLGGILMYIGTPWLMTLMTPDVQVQALTTRVLRIEAFAEPLYAASIVIYGIFVGAGDTKMPSIMNLATIWFIRLPLALLLVGYYGLVGFWIAMATELNVRGAIFLIRLFVKNRKLRKNYAIY